MFGHFQPGPRPRTVPRYSTLTRPKRDQEPGKALNRVLAKRSSGVEPFKDLVDHVCQNLGLPRHHIYTLRLPSTYCFTHVFLLDETFKKG